jgi:hypothetical protein
MRDEFLGQNPIEIRLQASAVENERKTHTRRQARSRAWPNAPLELFVRNGLARFREPKPLIQLRGAIAFHEQLRGAIAFHDLQTQWLARRRRLLQQAPQQFGADTSAALRRCNDEIHNSDLLIRHVHDDSTDASSVLKHHVELTIGKHLAISSALGAKLHSKELRARRPIPVGQRQFFVA